MYGYSLLELLITLAIIFLMAVLVVPSQKIFFEKNNQDTIRLQLLRAINLARSEAMLRSDNIILCHSKDQTSCSGEWQEGYVILQQEKVINAFTNKTNGKIFWRTFPVGQKNLEFLATGFSHAQNGTFWFCEKNSENPAWAILISQSGRAREVFPDKDNKIMDEKGKNLPC